MDGAWKKLNQMAAGRHRIVTPQMLDACGISRRTFYDHAAEHGYRHRHRRVWTLPGTAWTFQTQCAAAAAALDRPHAFTDEAGLHLLGPTLRRPRTVTALVRGDSSGGGHARVVVRRATRFDDVPTTRVDGLVVATVEQCLVDSAQRLSIDDLIRRIAAACRLRLTDLDRFEGYVHGCGRFAGLPKVAAALSALRGEMVHSTPEQVARDAVRPLELGFHPAPYTVVDGNGRFVAEVDLAIPELRYGSEVDGPHHLLEEQRQADETRDRMLRDLTWRIDRHRWDDVLASPERFAAKVRAAVASRRRELGLA